MSSAILSSSANLTQAALGGQQVTLIWAFCIENWKMILWVKIDLQKNFVHNECFSFRPNDGRGEQIGWRPLTKKNLNLRRNNTKKIKICWLSSKFVWRIEKLSKAYSRYVDFEAFDLRAPGTAPSSVDALKLFALKHYFSCSWWTTPCLSFGKLLGFRALTLQLVHLCV